MRVLVTGCAGLIGSNFCKWLVTNHPECVVVGVDDLSGGYEFPECVIPIKADLACAEDQKRVSEAFPVDYVFHFAAYAAEGLSPFIRQYNYQNNTVATAFLVSESIKHSVKRFVFTSSMAVYGNSKAPFDETMLPTPVDPYGIAKYACEMDLKVAWDHHRLEYCIIRPHNVYGPGQNIWDPYRNVLGIWIYQSLHRQPMTIYGDGEQKRAFSYIDDMMQPLYNAAILPSAKNEIINLGGMVETSLNDACIELSGVTGFWPKVYLEQRHEVKYAWSTYEKSVKCLGYKETVHIQEGLSRMWEWAKKQPDRPRKTWENYELDKGLYSFWKKKPFYKRGPWIGIGNLLWHLAMLYEKCPDISKNVLDNEFGTCIDLQYFTPVQDESFYVNEYVPIEINNETDLIVRKNLPKIVKPSPFMQQLICDHEHLVSDVCFGINIRCGSLSSDSCQFSDTTDIRQMFCNSDGLKKFLDLIRNAPGKVYVSSDSPSTKEFIKNLFGDKVTMLDTEFVHTSDVDFAGKRTPKNFQDVYLTWFLLSMCPHIYVTGGTFGSTFLSTFGLVAAMYGNKPCSAIYNN